MLVAKDKSVINDIKAGNVFARDPETNITKRVQTSDYGGLFNRSRHMLNAKVFYNDEDRGLTVSARLIYRGRYGFADANNNTILDHDSEYVDGYLTCNLSVGKSFQEIFKVQIGCDNVFDYTEALYIPNLPGRLLWASIALTFSKKD
jgi:outer membrane receptor for ferrienterochelin and colicins